MQSELAKDAEYQLSLKRQKHEEIKAWERAEDMKNMREYQKQLEKDRR